MKIYFFLQIIWSVQKKAVPLHSVSEMKLGHKIGAVVQLVRIHACHAWGRGFESRPHRKKKQKCFFFCYILTTTNILSITGSWRVHNGFIPYFPRYYSDTTPLPLWTFTEGREKRCRTLVAKNYQLFLPYPSVKNKNKSGCANPWHTHFFYYDNRIYTVASIFHIKARTPTSSDWLVVR